MTATHPSGKPEPAGSTAAAAQKRVLNRLRRAQGQLNAVITAVERGGECRDAVIQLAAVSKALDRAGFAIIGSAMRTCIAADAADPGDAVGTEGTNRLTVDELEQLFLTLA